MITIHNIKFRYSGKILEVPFNIIMELIIEFPGGSESDETSCCIYVRS